MRSILLALILAYPLLGGQRSPETVEPRDLDVRLKAELDRVREQIESEMPRIREQIDAAMAELKKKQPVIREEIARAMERARADIGRAREELERYREERERRVAVADEKLSSRDMKGSTTDRGRIYVEHGPPDVVERSSDGGETWRYKDWRGTRGTMSFTYDSQGRLKRD